MQALFAIDPYPRTGLAQFGERRNLRVYNATHFGTVADSHTPGQKSIIGFHDPIRKDRRDDLGKAAFQMG